MKMREILFHGKRADNGEWVEGDLLQIKYYNKPIIECKIMPQTPVSSAYPVLSETVGQYTGLTDRNGKKIFEGDIVTGWFNHEKIVGYIFYGENARFFIQRDGIYGIGLDNASNWLEVIGNINDSPELLGREDT